MAVLRIRTENLRMRMRHMAPHPQLQGGIEPNMEFVAMFEPDWSWKWKLQPSACILHQIYFCGTILSCQSTGAEM